MFFIGFVHMRDMSYSATTDDDYVFIRDEVRQMPKFMEQFHVLIDATENKEIMHLVANMYDDDVRDEIMGELYDRTEGDIFHQYEACRGLFHKLLNEEDEAHYNAVFGIFAKYHYIGVMGLAGEITTHLRRMDDKLTLIILRNDDEVNE